MSRFVKRFCSVIAFASSISAHAQLPPKLVVDMQRSAQSAVAMYKKSGMSELQMASKYCYREKRAPFSCVNFDIASSYIDRSMADSLHMPRDEYFSEPNFLDRTGKVFVEAGLTMDQSNKYLNEAGDVIEEEVRKNILGNQKSVELPAPQHESACSDAIQQIASAAAYVGHSNYTFQLNQNKQARLILFLQPLSNGTDKQKWRLIERQAESINYCVTSQGEHFSQLGDMHLGNPAGKYGVPGSGLQRCAGEQESGLPGSFDIRMSANKELGDSLIYSLSSNIKDRDYIFLTSNDNTGAWVILDSPRSGTSDTCYYARGDSSSVVRDVGAK